MKFDFEKLPKFLRRRANETDVKALIECEPDKIVRFEHAGFVELKDNGVSVMFKEATWAVPKEEIVDSKELYLSAFHLHRQGHEDYSEYKGRFPQGVTFGDSAAEVISKLGQPIATGGGGMSTVLKKPIPRWMRYPIGEAYFQFQFDENMKVEMVTLYIPDQKPAQ